METFILILNLFIVSCFLFFLWQNNQNNQKKDNELKDQLKNLVKEISLENNSNIQNANLTEIKKTLSPFKEQLQRELDVLKENIQQQNIKGAEARAKFGEQINNLLSATTEMQEDAQNLTKALKGDTKQQGDWGEQILEKSLEDAALQKDINYKLQPSYKTKDGGQLRPDAVIFLTEDRNIIIDSKVSLTAYEKYVKTDNSEEKKLYLKEHIASVKNHIMQLSSKNYNELEEINSPDYLFIFFQIEAALSLALSNDMKLQKMANEKRIAFLTPINLMAILRITEHLWQIDKHNKYAEDVAERAGLLLTKYANFIDSFSEVADKLEGAKTSYLMAHKRLTEGSGSLHTQMIELEKLGMKGKKNLSVPKNLKD